VHTGCRAVRLECGRNLSNVRICEPHDGTPATIRSWYVSFQLQFRTTNKFPDAHTVDLRTPSAFFEDIASVTTLLKQFFLALPDPLLTAAQYRAFLEAARYEDDIQRRDGVHALVNSLPDPNYATLRVLAIHLHKVAQHADRNRMTHNNLATIFAPTLMGHSSGANGTGMGGADLADAQYQPKVIETILDNTFQIFDADDVA
jgi:Rho GTPase-activating protein RGD1